MQKKKKIELNEYDDRTQPPVGVGIFLVEPNAKQSLAIADSGHLLDNGHVVGADTSVALAMNEKVKAAHLRE